MLNGQKWVPVGFNVYWGAFNQNFGYPSHAQVDEMFYAAQQMQANVIRCFSVGFSAGTGNALIQPDLSLNSNAWPAIDYFFYKAGLAGVKVIAPPPSLQTIAASRRHRSSLTQGAWRTLRRTSANG